MKNQHKQIIVQHKTTHIWTRDKLEKCSIIENNLENTFSENRGRRGRARATSLESPFFPRFIPIFPDLSFMERAHFNLLQFTILMMLLLLVNFARTVSVRWTTQNTIFLS